MLTVFNIDFGVLLKMNFMKHFITIFSLFSLLEVSIISGQTSYIDGNWYNTWFDKNIRIVTLPDGMKIKGIHSGYGWTYFERCGKHTFCDGFNNLIKLYSQNELVYFNRNRRTKLTFYPANQNIKPDGYGRNFDENNQRLSDKKNFKNEDNSGHDIEQKSEKDTNRINTKNSDYVSPEGTWKVADPNKLVYIVDTRDGIKARFSDESKWYIFKNDPDNAGSFISEMGHRYEYINKNLMVWRDKENKRQYNLTRIKDNIE